MIESWLRAIRDHPQRPPAMQRLCLHYLALRLDDRSGKGFASTAQIMADADASKSTVIRATNWARDENHKFLERTRRGNRHGKANEWRLLQSLSVTGDTLNQSLGLTHDTLSQSLSVNGSASKCQQGTTNKSPIHQESPAAALNGAATGLNPSPCEHGEPRGPNYCGLCRQHNPSLIPPKVKIAAKGRT